MNIIRAAEKYLGQRELKGNVFLDNTELGVRLHEAGQKDGEAWCAYFMEAIFKEAYPRRAKEFSKLFSASAVQTMKNFAAAGHQISKIPVPGSMMVMQKKVNGKFHWSGHIGLVIARISNIRFTSIEGNTNEVGGREGISVQSKIRRVVPVNDGLEIQGFIIVKGVY